MMKSPLFAGNRLEANRLEDKRLGEKTMRKRGLPIPLILLTPLLLLVLVVAAGVYRFSLSDDDILAKFPSRPASSDEIVEQLFDVKVSAPLTIGVPGSFAFALINRRDDVRGLLLGSYDSGQQRGEVALDARTVLKLAQYSQRYGYAGIIRVSDQSRALMYYLALFEFDAQRQRMVMTDSLWLGDRIVVQALEQKDDQLNVSLLTHDENQAVSEVPTKFKSILVGISQKYQLIQ
ncbi:hypothetical protein [Vibrio sp. H11]|uniref:hypothetical protein n=1 Tax=Vibrio sp. H11 TaxID=2565928 RepID=UPI001F103F6F|nr:hypothetical protein [Vibrio sp. H11]